MAEVIIRSRDRLYETLYGELKWIIDPETTMCCILTAKFSEAFQLKKWLEMQDSEKIYVFEHYEVSKSCFNATIVLSREEATALSLSFNVQRTIGIWD